MVKSISLIQRKIINNLVTEKYKNRRQLLCVCNCNTHFNKNLIYLDNNSNIKIFDWNSKIKHYLVLINKDYTEISSVW